MSMTNAEVLEGVNEAMRRHGEIMEKRHLDNCDEIRSIHAEHRALIAANKTSVRELAAIAAMQAILANPEIDDLGPHEVAHDARSFADALIAELAK